jgi:lysophospholipase L1-like esterase
MSKMLFSVFFIVLFLQNLSCAAVQKAEPTGYEQPGAYVVNMPYYKDKAALFALLAARNKPKKHTVVFLGDSLTDHAEWAELLAGKGLSVLNRGIAGDTAYGVLQRLYSVAALNPEKIFLMIGVNNLLQGHDQVAVREQYRQIVSSLRQTAPLCRIYLQTLLPVNREIAYRYNNGFLLPEGFNTETVASFNSFINSLGSEDENIFIIDLYSLFLRWDTGQLNELYTSDGVHLNAFGYEVWANEVKKHL